MSNLVYSVDSMPSRYIIVTKRPLLKRVIISWPCMARRGTARVSHWHRFQKSQAGMLKRYSQGEVSKVADGK